MGNQIFVLVVYVLTYAFLFGYTAYLLVRLGRRA